MTTALKCRFCDWTTPRSRRIKGGQVQHGYPRLDQHVEHAHRAMYESHANAYADEWTEDEEAILRETQREDWNERWP